MHLINGFRGTKTPEQLTNIVSLIQTGAKVDDIRALEPLNYFKHVSMPAFLESDSLATGVSNEIITPMTAVTNETMLENYVTKLMALLEVEGMINKESLKALKERLKSDKATIDEALSGKAGEIGKKLVHAIEPLYDTFKQMYSPFFSDIRTQIKDISPRPLMPIMDMLKVFTVSELEDGIYKYTNVPANLMEFIRKLNTNYAQFSASAGKFQFGSKRTFAYLYDNLAIPRIAAQFDLSQSGGADEPPKAVQAVLSAAKSAAEAAATASAKPTTGKTTVVKKPALTEEEKQGVLTNIQAFFTNEDNTIYIISGANINTVPIKLFTVSATQPTDASAQPLTPGYSDATLKVRNIFPTISSSKPLSMELFMFAGFIAFKRGLKTIVKEGIVPAPEPAPVAPTPAPAPGTPVAPTPAPAPGTPVAPEPAPQPAGE
jgi:hypothetical protein